MADQGPDKLLGRYQMFVVIEDHKDGIVTTVQKAAVSHSETPPADDVMLGMARVVAYVMDQLSAVTPSTTSTLLKNELRKFYNLKVTE